MTNNAPYVSLDLNKAQAQFMLKNCDSNIKLALSCIMECESQEQAEPFVLLNEQFKEIRAMLIKQGVSLDDV